LPDAALVAAGTGHFGPDALHDLVRLVLSDLDEVVIEITTLSRN
jgi:hypothetical protein